MFIKNHSNSPYFDDSYLDDIEVWKVKAVVNGEIVDTDYAPCELSDLGKLSEELLMYNDGAKIQVELITLRDCPHDVQDDILKRFEDTRAQDDYENIKYYRELY